VSCMAAVIAWPRIRVQDCAVCRDVLDGQGPAGARVRTLAEPEARVVCLPRHGCSGDDCGQRRGALGTYWRGGAAKQWGRDGACCFSPAF
jgi:hypothetical protein